LRVIPGTVGRCGRCGTDEITPKLVRKFAARLEEFHRPFFYYEIIEGGHNFGANLKESAETKAVDYIYLTRKLMD
jgi:prolyl oligopeptidase